MKNLDTTPEYLISLERSLEAEVQCYENSAERMQAKKLCLLSGDLENLEKVDQELFALHQRARQLESQRLELMGAIGHPKTPLSQIIPQLPPTHAGKFHQIRQRLVRAIREVDTLNRNHQDLLTLSLKWVEESVSVIADILTPEATSYTGQGKSTKGPKRPTNNLAPPQSTVSHKA